MDCNPRNGEKQIDDSVVISASRDSALLVPKDAKNRITNVDDKEFLIITEVHIGDYFGDDKIIRYEYLYGRV